MEDRRIIKAGFSRLGSNEMEMSRKLYICTVSTVAAQQQPLMKTLKISRNQRSAKLHIL